MARFVMLLFSIVILTSFVSAQDWTDERYDHRQNFVLSNSVDRVVISDFQAFLTLDTAALISNGELDANCRGLAIFYKDEELHRLVGEEIPVSDPEFGGSTCNSEDTIILFTTQTDLPPNGFDSNYYLYYANDPSIMPKNDPDEVYWFYDDFSDELIDDKLYHISGSWVETSGHLISTSSDEPNKIGMNFTNRAMVNADAQMLEYKAWQTCKSSSTGQTSSGIHHDTNGDDYKFLYGRMHNTYAGRGWYLYAYDYQSSYSSTGGKTSTEVTTTTWYNYTGTHKSIATGESHTATTNTPTTGQRLECDKSRGHCPESAGPYSYFVCSKNCDCEIDEILIRAYIHEGLPEGTLATEQVITDSKIEENVAASTQDDESKALVWALDEDLEPPVSIDVDDKVAFPHLGIIVVVIALFLLYRRKSNK